MNIVYATDDNGALGTGVSIVSLMENLPPGVHADIYIMTGGLAGIIRPVSIPCNRATISICTSLT